MRAHDEPYEPPSTSSVSLRFGKLACIVRFLESLIRITHKEGIFLAVPEITRKAWWKESTVFKRNNECGFEEK